MKKTASIYKKNNNRKYNSSIRKKDLSQDNSEINKYNNKCYIHGSYRCPNYCLGNRLKNKKGISKKNQGKFTSGKHKSKNKKQNIFTQNEPESFVSTGTYTDTYTDTYSSSYLNTYSGEGSSDSETFISSCSKCCSFRECSNKNEVYSSNSSDSSDSSDSINSNDCSIKSCSSDSDYDTYTFTEKTSNSLPNKTRKLKKNKSKKNKSYKSNKPNKPNKPKKSKKSKKSKKPKKTRKASNPKYISNKLFSIKVPTSKKKSKTLKIKRNKKLTILSNTLDINADIKNGVIQIETKKMKGDKEKISRGKISEKKNYLFSTQTKDSLSIPIGSEIAILNQNKNIPFKQKFKIDSMAEITLNSKVNSFSKFSINYGLFRNGLMITNFSIERSFENSITEVPNLTWIDNPPAGLNAYEIRITIRGTNIVAAFAKTRALNLTTFE